MYSMRYQKRIHTYYAIFNLNKRQHKKIIIHQHLKMILLQDKKS